MQFNLRFETDKQFIEDMASAMLKCHLEYAGCGETLPSSHTTYMEGDAQLAWRRGAVEQPDEWLFETEFTPMFKEAKRIADKKWLAAMTLLGIGAM